MYRFNDLTRGLTSGCMSALRPSMSMRLPRECSRRSGGSQRADCRRTFVQPIAEPVEDNALLASRHQANGTVVNPGAIVDVVLEDKDLHEPEREGGRGREGRGSTAC